MSSILTNNAAITALQNLATTQASLQKTQNQISTGMKVSTAADNASYWSIATQMRSDNGALGAVKDALNTGGAMLDTMSAAVTSTIDVMNKIKNNLVAAKQPGADVAKIGTDMTSLGNQLKNIVSSSVFNDLNLLDGSTAAGGPTVDFVASFTNSKVGTINVQTTDLITSGNTGVLQTAKAAGSATATDFTALQVSDLSAASIDVTTANVDKAISDLTSYASNMGAYRSQMTSQMNFVSALSDSLTKGISSLVDADMNEASTKLQALQVQQQLGVQSLSISNQNTQMILKLFQ